MARVLPVVLAMTWAVAPAAQAPPVQGAVAFKSAFLRAMASGDRQAIARMIRFPATADVGGFNVPLIDRATMFEIYDVVFTPALRCELERHPARPDEGGGTLADGRVRLVRDGGALKIARIVVPGATGAAPPPPSAPQQAWFRRGQAQFTGRLYGDGVDAYLVTARKGALLNARIEKFPGRGALVRVVDSRGRPVGRSTGAAPRLWAGTIPADGQYRVEVVRLAPYCEPPFTYFLAMTLR